jgi:hypothetical protein
MAGESKITVDHDEIRRWVEERGGWPATVKGTAESGEEAGLLRIDFPGYSGEERLERISWEDFFEKFEESRLAFVYQEETRNEQPSRFGKLVSRDWMESRQEAEEAQPATRGEG